MGEKRKRGKKGKNKRGNKIEGNRSRKEGKYPYFVSLFDIGRKKRQEFIKIYREESNIYQGGHYICIYPCLGAKSTGGAERECSL